MNSCAMADNCAPRWLLPVSRAARSRAWAVRSNTPIGTAICTTSTVSEPFSCRATIRIPFGTGCVSVRLTISPIPRLRQPRHHQPKLLNALLRVPRRRIRYGQDQLLHRAGDRHVVEPPFLALRVPPDVRERPLGTPRPDDAPPPQALVPVDGRQPDTPRAGDALWPLSTGVYERDKLPDGSVLARHLQDAEVVEDVVVLGRFGVRNPILPDPGAVPHAVDHVVDHVPRRGVRTVGPQHLADRPQFPGTVAHVGVGPPEAGRSLRLPFRPAALCHDGGVPRGSEVATRSVVEPIECCRTIHVGGIVQVR